MLALLLTSITPGATSYSGTVHNGVILNIAVLSMSNARIFVPFRSMYTLYFPFNNVAAEDHLLLLYLQILPGGNRANDKVHVPVALLDIALKNIHSPLKQKCRIICACCERLTILKQERIATRTETALCAIFSRFL